MSDINVEETLRELVAEICEVESEEVTPTADFVEELGMDSMQALEIMAAAEKKLGIEIPEENLGKITNLANMVELTESIVKA